MGRKRLVASADDAMSENALLAHVRDAAQKLGWREYHPWWSGHSTQGFPDLTLVRRGRLIFAELKRMDGTLSWDQTGWLADLEETCAEVYVWRPDAWSSGEIARVLAP